MNQTPTEKQTPAQRVISDWLQKSANEIGSGQFNNWINQLYSDLNNFKDQPIKITDKTLTQPTVQFRLRNNTHQMG